jgi:iron(III) transport system ATP-binding protein
VIAGFETPDAGRVSVGGHEVAGNGTWVEPEHRRIGMVFQDGALFPHLSVEGNVAFGAASRARAADCLALVGLEQRARDFPHELSGGERQRIALARALAADPSVVLLDEPFAALDAGLREALRQEVRGILKAAGTSALLVTHDQAEALSLADTVAVMRAGRVEQVGTPEEVYERPASRWLAEFVGETEVLPGTARDGMVECELGRFGVPAELAGTVDVVLRPESVAIGHGAAPGAHAEAVVLERSFYGHDQLVDLELASGVRVRSRRLGFPAWHPGDRVRVWIDGPVSALTPESARTVDRARG